jgi:hypothetical protein
MLSTVLELLGLAAIVAAAASVDVALGVALAGLALLVVGLFAESR